jgi:magnesium transporter
MMNAPKANKPASPGGGTDITQLVAEVSRRSASDAVRFLEPHPASRIAKVMEQIHPALRQEILALLDPARRAEVLDATGHTERRQWERNQSYEEGTIGRLMEPPIAVFPPAMTIAEAVEGIRNLAGRAFVTYGFVCDEQGKLLGLLVMRELLLGRPGQRLDEIMLRNPFALHPEQELTEAMREVLHRHYPIYPVCDAEGRLIGLVRGQNLFEAQAIEISAQAGEMVGVDKEERLATPLTRSFRFRHPWLQLNLLTAFIAAAVVGIFQNTLEQIVILAVFLPVLIGQAGNTGCQALAVALRGMTLGELKSGRERGLVLKEAVLGSLNGVFTGITAGLGMWVYAVMQKRPDAVMMGFIVFVAMILSCVFSGIAGALVPLGLRRLGADPATASSIFVTTVTDVAGTASFLGLATWLIHIPKP